MRVCDVPKELWQSKHKRGPKNVNELLNDKSDIKAMKTKYEEYKYGCIYLRTKLIQKTIFYKLYCYDLVLLM